VCVCVCVQGLAVGETNIIKSYQTKVHNLNTRKSGGSRGGLHPTLLHPTLPAQKH
jgi:hypothetical protein